jgi:hypothetical protein
VRVSLHKSSHARLHRSELDSENPQGRDHFGALSEGSAGTGKVNVEAGSVREAGIFPDKRATRLVNAAGDIGTSREAGGFSESARQAKTFLDPIPAMLIRMARDGAMRGR